MTDQPLLFAPEPAASAYRRARALIALRLGIPQHCVRHVLAAQPEHEGPGVPSYLRTARILLADPEPERRVDAVWLASMRRTAARERREVDTP